MSRLIIMIENSGEGKRYITDCFFGKNTFDTVLVKKYTTRLSRKSEDIIDLAFNHPNIMDNCSYIYAYDKNYYGIQKEDIDFALKGNMNPVIFVTK